MHSGARIFGFANGIVKWRAIGRVWTIILCVRTPLSALSSAVVKDTTNATGLDANANANREGINVDGRNLFIQLM